jgi:hypothetical protein
MGKVYRARDTRLDRTVAIKILPQHLASDPGRRAPGLHAKPTRFPAFHTPTSAPFDIGDQHGIHYVVLEYLEGGTLGDRLAKGSLPISEVLKGDIASALDTAHRHGIVHRDVLQGHRRPSVSRKRWVSAYPHIYVECRSMPLPGRERRPGCRGRRFFAEMVGI